MYPFWDSIILPIFDVLQPREIVEIGADYGHNTRNILAYCRKTGSRAHIIDPQPNFDTDAFRTEFGDVFKFYESLSLNALPLIDRMDAVLIDGDHNWYTVYHELELIEKQSQKGGLSFPLVLVHDVAWPYARRDMYYYPENIPEAYRLPYLQKGLDPDSRDLIEKGGLNPHLCNAVYEHNLKNGVLTAVEDFIKGAGRSLSLVTIPVFHGLGILYPSSFAESHPPFVDFVQKLSAPDVVLQLLVAVEESRVKHVIAEEENRQKLRDLEAARRRESEKAQQEIRDLQQRIDSFEHRLRSKSDQLFEIMSKRRHEIERLRAEIEENINKFKALEQKSQAFKHELKQKQESLESLVREKRRLNRERDQLSQWVSQLQEQFNALMQSKRWRMGHGLVSLLTLSMFKKNFTMATDHIKRIFNQVEYFRSTSGHHAPDQPRPSRGQGLSKPYPQRRHNLTVGVLAWDVGHNPLGRAYLLADVLSRYFHVVLLGPLFTRYNNQVWEPLKNSNIEVLSFPGREFPELLEVFEKAAQRIEADVIVACKPRLPSVQLGLMIKAFKNRPLFIDIDDYELSFFKEKTPLSISDIRKNKKYKDLAIPFERTWTRFTESLLIHADGLFVSNHTLEKKFGGIIIPHARDERRFDPSLYDKNQRRRELGIGVDDKIVLFLGTPRPHKGVKELLDAVKACANDHYKLCVIGSPPDKQYENRLKRLGGSSLIMLPDQPFDKLPENLVIADLVCLIQNPESEIAKYQLPAKVIDALAMGIPVLATRTPPLEALIEAGAVEPVDMDGLSRSIDRVLSDSERCRSKQIGKRDLFLKQYSYAAIGEKLYNAMLHALDHPKPLAGDALDFIKVQKAIPAEKGLSGKGGIDIVIFWKQNDTGLYGRRSDMFVKYLARRKEVRKIAVFDMPISVSALRDKAGANGITHDRFIYRETLLRNWGVRDTDKISFHTFIYQNGVAGSDKSVWRYPDKSGYLEFIQTRLDEAGIESKDAVFWFYPENAYIPKIVKRFRPKLKVVDLVDDHRTWSDLSEIRRLYLTRHYKEVLRPADLVLSNCQQVQASMKKYHDGIRLVPNGCELDPPPDLSSDPRFQQFLSMGGPRLGYVGNLEKDKIDPDLVQFLAESRPDWRIFLIGSTHANPDILALDAYPNVHFMGVVPYPDVRAWIRAFDVAILPHLNSRKTRSMNPLKLYVYCSLSVPVVSTDIENLDELRDYVSVADGYDDFLKKVERFLENREKPASKPLSACLLKNTWEMRVDQVLNEILAML